MYIACKMYRVRRGKEFSDRGENKMKRQIDWKDHLYIALAFVVMGLLFYSTSMGYEEQNVQPLLSQWLSGEPFRNMLEGIQFTYAQRNVSIDSLGYVGFIEFFIRKGAHFFSYFLLGLFWYLGLRNRMNSTLLAFCLAIGLSAGYASFDELRQAFHPNRTALLEDVFLDTVGATTGAVIGYYYTSKKGKRRRKYSISHL